MKFFYFFFLFSIHSFRVIFYLCTYFTKDIFFCGMDMLPSSSISLHNFSDSSRWWWFFFSSLCGSNFEMVKFIAQLDDDIYVCVDRIFANIYVVHKLLVSQNDSFEHRFRFFFFHNNNEKKKKTECGICLRFLFWVTGKKKEAKDGISVFSYRIDNNRDESFDCPTIFFSFLLLGLCVCVCVYASSISAFSLDDIQSTKNFG